MRDDLPLKLALTCGLTAASTAVFFVASPVSIPLFVLAGGALGISVAELVNHR